MGTPLRPALAAPDDFQRYLEAAVQRYESLEYERALAQLQRARSVARGVEQDVSLGLHEGILLAELDRWDEARASFETALLLEPSATLPLRVSPKVEREFESIRKRVHASLARRKQASRPGTATPPSAPKPGTPSAPPPPVAGSDRPEQPRPSRLTPSEPPPPPPPVTVEASPRRAPGVPLALLGAGVVAGGLGAFFGVSANQRLDEARVAPFRDDALARFNEAQGSARTANVLFGTAGLALAGAVVTWFLLPGDSPSPDSSSSSEVSR